MNLWLTGMLLLSSYPNATGQPTTPQLVHSDTETVTALNQRKGTWLTTESNLLLLNQLGWHGTVQEVPMARIELAIQQQKKLCTLDRVQTVHDFCRSI